MKKFIDNLLKRLDAVPADKWQHFAVGVMISAIVFVAAIIVARAFVSEAVAFGAALALSVLLTAGAAMWKEYGHDAMPDKADIVATMAGGAVLWAVEIVGYLIMS